MQHPKLNWTLILFLLASLIFACGGQSESESPETTAAEEQKSEAPATTEETTAAEDTEEALEVRQATTVMAAGQIIDLRNLSLPDEAELMGQPEIGDLRYQAPIEVAEAADLHRSDLIDQGWQEDAELGYAEDVTVSTFFTKADFTLSLSASDMDEDKTMVSLINLGNIDLRTLPQMADAEDVYYFPSTFGYFSPTDVAGVADFTLQELAAQGWHEYTRPNTDMADDPEQKSFSLIQNGLELSVSVGAAPAQGGKTAVQYSVSLLSLDLPIPAGAAGLELEKTLPFLSLSYTTSDDFETLFDYYSQEMTALGWVVIDSIGMMTPERTTLFFGNENLPPHTLVLDLIPSDGQTLATLRNYDVDELTELNAPGESSPAEETSQIAGDAAGEIPNIPIPDEAMDVAYDVDLEHVSYTTLSDAETVADFYRQSLPALGWQEDEDSGMANETFIDIRFKQAEETIVFEIIDSSTPTRVTAFLRYAPSLLETIGDDTSTGEDAAAMEIEANVGDTIEIGYLSFAVIEVTSPAESAFEPDEGHKFLDIVFTIENKHTSDTISAFSLLWLSINDSGGNTYGYDGMGFTAVDDPDDSYGAHNGTVAPGEQARGKITFQIPVDAEELVFVVYAPELDDSKVFVALGSGVSTREETTTDSGPDAPSTNIPSFLTSSDAQNVVYDADLGEIIYTSPSDGETVFEFYRQSLPAEGWQEDELFSTVEENIAFGMFNKGADSLNVTIISTGITEVTVDLSFAPSLVEIIESGPSMGEDTTTGTETKTSDSGPLSLIEEDGFPLPSDYTDLGTMETPFALLVNFGSPSTVEAVVELYETELPGQGWEFIEHNLDGEIAYLHFEGDNQNLSISVWVNSGEISSDLAGQTAVELSIKDPVAAAEAGVLPPSDQTRIVLINSAADDLTATINQQEFELAPVPISTEFPENLPSIDLPPGQYTLTTIDPDGSVTNHDIEIGFDKEIAPGETWALILDIGMSPMEWPVY